ncbi:MAG: carboxypeptidase regulatory-like domain-containing protein [Gemmatimonadaceae bacterium]
MSAISFSFNVRVAALSGSLLLPLPAAAAHPFDCQVVGKVTDISSIPIPEVEVSVVRPAGMGRSVLTAKDGRFIISGLPEGAVLLRFRRLGYEVREVEVRVGDEKLTSTDVVLKPIPEELDSITIRSEERAALREFYEHKSTRGSYAKFFTAEDIRKRGASYASDMFRSVPGVTLAASAFPGSTVRIRGCMPMLWIDGQRIPNSELDDVISPGDIAGLEFYTSLAGTPAQYMDRTTRACGSILVWTKNR